MNESKQLIKQIEELIKYLFIKWVHPHLKEQTDYAFEMSKRSIKHIIRHLQANDDREKHSFFISLIFKENLSLKKKILKQGKIILIFESSEIIGFNGGKNQDQDEVFRHAKFVFKINENKKKIKIKTFFPVPFGKTKILSLTGREVLSISQTSYVSASLSVIKKQI